MKIDNTSMFFNASIPGATATAAWGTAVGQSVQNGYKIKTDIDGLVDLLIGMNYKIRTETDTGKLNVSAMSRSRELLFFSIFDKIYVNENLVEDTSFILLLVKEHSESHNGRIIVSYPNYASYTDSDGIIKNSTAIEKMGEKLNCKSGCWFVYDISVVNQDELHLNAIIVAKSPITYPNSSARKDAWEELVRNKFFPPVKIVSYNSSAFINDAKSVGLHFSQHIFLRFTASLLTKSFVILTGLSGSGKTKLAQAFARWIAVMDSSYEVVPVGADWTGNENVLGYPNGLDNESYISKPALNLVVRAKDHPDIPHFLILDEMNLSHVERYFADILSAIESEEVIQLYDGADRKADDVPIPKRIELPKNLFIIGTLNVDETTYMFSPKVLDRANVIEFRMVTDEMATFLGNPAKPDLSKLDGKGASFGKAFVDAAKSPATIPSNVKALYDAEMMLLFKTLQGHGAEFGYRTAYETARFIHFFKLLGKHTDDDITWFTGAFDCVVFQKFLPKLHGSRAKIGPVLKNLWFLCVNDTAGRGTDPLTAAKESKAEPLETIPDSAPYPRSAEKIFRMWRLLMENGFASFAES